MTQARETERDQARRLEPDRSTGVQVLRGRDVPLGGIRSLNVSRTLPHRDRSFIGAWCFVDHYGPTRVVDADRDGMDVPPHPHTGLQTVSWLFSGEVEHRDSAGVHAMVRPGEMNLMTSGHGIAHSEVSTPDTSILHGVQLWVALPEADRDTVRDFQHYVPDPQLLDGGTVLVFIGELPGLQASPFTLPLPCSARNCGWPAARRSSCPSTARSSTPCSSTPARYPSTATHSSAVIQVAGYTGPVERIPAPPIPHVRLRPRSRHGRAPRTETTTGTPAAS